MLAHSNGFAQQEEHHSLNYLVKERTPPADLPTQKSELLSVENVKMVLFLTNKNFIWHNTNTLETLHPRIKSVTDVA